MAKTPVRTQYPPAAEETAAGITSNPQALATLTGAPVSTFTAGSPALAAESILGKPAMGADAQAFLGLSTKQASKFDGFGSAQTPTSSLAVATKQFEAGTKAAPPKTHMPVRKPGGFGIC